MSDAVTEALLELHYHRAIVQALSLALGARFLRMLKPSTQREAWVGFDQGWVRTSITDAELYQRLTTAMATSATAVNEFYLGYFLQFKVVHTIGRWDGHEIMRFLLLAASMNDAGAGRFFTGQVESSL